ncbi:MAG TPA: helix-turn-helix domain-containing protein [Gemmataceae bacterium]|jgi:chromosomal replication initiator protein|nr:helix-turn-helix domain-containing protein [Gemmataceae bacterium]
MTSRFVALPENRSAHEAVGRLGDAIATGTDFPLLFLHGPPGSGKSLLASGLVEQVAQIDPPKTAQTVAAAEIGRSLMQPPAERREVSKEAVGCDLLVIEDIQHLPPAAGDEMAAILDRRQARRRATLVTAIRGPVDIALPGRLAGRLAGGLVVGIPPLGEPGRRLFALTLCEERGLKVTRDVVSWLARDPGGTRPILGGLALLEALAKVHPPPLTLAVVKADVPQIEESESPLERIAKCVAERYRVPIKALRGPSRIKNVAWARQVAMRVAREAGFSFPQIGTYFNRDHSTVMHSCSKVAEAATKDAALARDLRELVAMVGKP